MPKLTLNLYTGLPLLGADAPAGFAPAFPGVYGRLEQTLGVICGATERFLCGTVTSIHLSNAFTGMQQSPLW